MQLVQLQVLDQLEVVLRAVARVVVRVVATTWVCPAFRWVAPPSAVAMATAAVVKGEQPGPVSEAPWRRGVEDARPRARLAAACPPKVLQGGQHTGYHLPNLH